MGLPKTTFRFVAPLSSMDAAFLKSALFVPKEIVSQLPGGRIRVKGTMNGAPFSLALLHLKDGSRYFAVSAALRKAARMKAGDQVSVSFKLVDPDRLHVPEELQAVLSQDADALHAWEKLTLGYQRSLIHYITSVKNVDSRIQRALELTARAKAGLLRGAKKKS